jgi:hypothetical protein
MSEIHDPAVFAWQVRHLRELIDQPNYFWLRQSR